MFPWFALWNIVFVNPSSYAFYQVTNDCAIIFWNADFIFIQSIESTKSVIFLWNLRYPDQPNPRSSELIFRSSQSSDNRCSIGKAGSRNWKLLYAIKRSLLDQHSCGVNMGSKWYAGRKNNRKRKHVTLQCEIRAHYIGSGGQTSVGALDRNFPENHNWIFRKITTSLRALIQHFVLTMYTNQKHFVCQTNFVAGSSDAGSPDLKLISLTIIRIYEICCMFKTHF